MLCVGCFCRRTGKRCVYIQKLVPFLLPAPPQWRHAIMPSLHAHAVPFEGRADEVIQGGRGVSACDWMNTAANEQWLSILNEHCLYQPLQYPRCHCRHPMLPVSTFTPCRSLLGSGGGTTASLVLMMGTMFIRRSSCSVLFRFCLFWSSWKSRFVTRTWQQNDQSIEWIKQIKRCRSALYRHIFSILKGFFS